MWNLKKIMYVLIFILFSACSKEESTINLKNHQEPLIELQFSEPPIELQGVQALFASDIPYDEFKETKFDVFIPSSSPPTGLVMFIHGGGFTSGDKSFIYSDSNKEKIIELLNNGIAVATINYRLLEKDDDQGILKCLADSKRALQYIRFIHQELNIDKNKIVLFGSSAGASTALWIATNNDLKETKSKDLVLQESSRVKGVVLNASQSSLDIEKRWVENVFIDFGKNINDIINEFGEERIYSMYGVNTTEEYNTTEINIYRSKVDMLSQLSPDDPEIWIRNTSIDNQEPASTSAYNHHPFHAREIRKFAEAANVPIKAIYGKPIIYNNSNGEDFVQFIIRKINE